MSVAIRTITRIQDADDVNVALGVGVDEYALSWDNDTAKFVLRAAGAPDLTGYALLAGRAGGQTLYGGTAANEDITIHGTSNGTRDTSYVLLQPSGGNVGIGTSAPDAAFHILGTGDSAYLLKVESTSVAHGYPGMFEVVCQDSLSDPQFKFHRATTGQGDFSFLVQGTGANNFLNIRSNHSGAPASSLVLQGSSGYVGVGLFTNVVLPATPLHVVSTAATTNALRNVLTLGSNVTGAGVGAAGLGAAVLFTMETSTTVDTSAASVQAIIYEATHATRKFDLVLNAYDTAIREGLRIRGDGSAPAIGFLGAAPQARIAHVADPSGGGTVDTEARSAINSILATLEGFGFHATS